MEEYTDKWTQLMERVIVKLEKECLEWQREFEKHGFSYVWDNAWEYVCRCELTLPMAKARGFLVQPSQRLGGEAPARLTWCPQA